MKSSTDFVKYCFDKIGTPYVYGTKMQLLTNDLYEWLRKTYGSKVWASDRDKIGKVCTDCSGLISSFTGITRNSAGYKAAASQIFGIDSIQLAPLGALVWNEGHIGVYVGNGEYIAADGSAVNTRKNRLPSTFTHWFLCPDLTYESESTTKHWAQPHFDALVKAKILEGDATSDIWKNFEMSLSSIKIGQFLALMNKLYQVSK